MKSLLLIDSESERAEAVCQQYASDALKIETAPDGFYALTMLERNRPELIMTRGKLKDMNASELCAILKYDRALSYLPIVLLAKNPEEAEELALEANFSLVLVDPTDQILDSILHRLPDLDLAQLEALAQDLTTGRSDHLSGPATIPVEPGLTEEALQQGSLYGNNNFWQLMELLTTAEKSGRLTLEPDGQDNFILFREGRILHASFEGMKGRQALAALLYAVKKNKHRPFELETVSDEELQAYPPGSGITAIELLRDIEKDMLKHNTLELRLPLNFLDKADDKGA